MRSPEVDSVSSFEVIPLQRLVVPEKLKRIHLHQCAMPSTGLPIVQLPTSLITFPLVIETIRSGEHIRHGEPSVGDLQLGRGDFDQEDDEEEIAKLPASWAVVEMFNMVIVQLHGSQSTARLLTAFAAPLLPPVTRSGTTSATTLVKSAVALLATDGGATRRPPLAAQPLVRHQDALSLNQVLDMHTQQKASQTSSAVSKMERAIFRDDIGDIVCGLFDCANAIVLAQYYNTVALQYHLNF